MRWLFLLAVCGGCAAQRVEYPYIRETVTSPDGTTRVIERSATSVQGGTLDAVGKSSR